MALPLPPGLTPPEIAFLCEMELVTVIPRQRLESLPLLGGPTPPLRPPHRSSLPLWLALLLKRQRRANIVPPPWLHPQSLAEILDHETNISKDAFSPAPRLPEPTYNELSSSSVGHYHATPPFTSSNIATAPANALPYHWVEIAEILLEAAADDIVEPETVRRLLRDLREVRMAKVRKGVSVLDAGAGVQMNGVGAMEVGESRAFISGVVDVLRKLGASREQARREREDEGGLQGSGGRRDDDDDDEMEL